MGGKGKRGDLPPTPQTSKKVIPPNMEAAKKWLVFAQSSIILAACGGRQEHFPFLPSIPPPPLALLATSEGRNFFPSLGVQKPLSPRPKFGQSPSQLHIPHPPLLGRGVINVNLVTHSNVWYYRMWCQRNTTFSSTHQIHFILGILQISTIV